jgi:hypothetical protein
MRPLLCGVALCLGLLAVGCGGGHSKKEVIEIKVVDSLTQAKNILKQYVEGQQLGSEVTMFPGIVDSVRKTDPAKADILQKGFEDLKKGGNIKSKAKDLLGKL